MKTEEFRAELENRILPFWKALKDEKNGGYIGYVDFDLKPDASGDKGCILNSRILWFFASAAMTLQDKALVPYARHAYAFLKARCLDPEYGGVYWSVHADGTPADTTKHTYNQAFAIYALAAYYRLTGEEEAKTLAFSLLDIIETHCRNAGGYCEAFTRDFKPASNDKLSENGVMAARTMNTLLHVFEGYSGLYEATQDARVGGLMRQILDIWMTHIYNPKLHREEVFFDSTYHSLIDLTSYGHDIETSWLMDWGCSLLHDREYEKRLLPCLGALAENTYEKAYQKHSLRAECERGTENETRVWWVQAETVLGFANAYQRTGDEKFRVAAGDVWEFIQQHVIDHRPGGEWFWQVDEAGAPLTHKAIVEPWKCPYHNGRMCMEMIRRNIE